MSTGSLIAQASLLTTILMLPQYAKLNIKRRKPEGKEVEEKKTGNGRSFRKKITFIVIYGSEHPVQGPSGRIFWHPSYPENDLGELWAPLPVDFSPSGEGHCTDSEAKVFRVDLGIKRPLHS